MSNLVTQYIRRIGKYLTEVGDKPVVAPENTNHVDDSVLWGNTTIYKGENVINLATGKSYTSDNAQIIELSALNAIIYGMQLVSVPSASNNADKLYLKISDGYIRVNGRLLKHKSIAVNAQTNGDVSVIENLSTLPRYDLVYAYNDPTNQAMVEGEHKAMLSVIPGSSNIQDLYNQTYIATKLASAGLLDISSVFLGFVYVPANYTASTQENMLRPWSFGVSSEGNGENLLNFNHSQMPDAQAVSPGALLNEVLSTVTTHYDSNGDLRKRYTYLAGQLLVFDNGQATPDKKIYKVVTTHFCESLSTSLSNNLIAVLGGEGGGGGGTDDHSYLLNLGYDESGHYGFQRKTIAATRNPEAGDSKIPVAPYEKADVGTIWLNTVTLATFICADDTSGAAVWVDTFANIKDTTADKNIQALITPNVDNNKAMIATVSYNPANNTYIKVEINGIGTIVGDGTKTNCECYFSNDNGITARAISEIQANDTLHWVGSYAGYELSTLDNISLYYLIASDNIPPLWDFSGPISGGDADITL